MPSNADLGISSNSPLLAYISSSRPVSTFKYSNLSTYPFTMHHVLAVIIFDHRITTSTFCSELVSARSSGIGLACAHHYAKSGMSVVLVDVNEEALKAAEQSIKQIQGAGGVLSMKVDVSNVEQVVALRDKVMDEYGEVSGVSAQAA